MTSVCAACLRVLDDRKDVRITFQDGPTVCSVDCVFVIRGRRKWA